MRKTIIPAGLTALALAVVFMAAAPVNAPAKEPDTKLLALYYHADW